MDDQARAMADLVSARGPALKRYAFLLCGDDAAADDLVQDAVVAALSRPFRRLRPESAEPYLRRSILNRHIDRTRAAKRWRRAAPLLPGPSSSDDTDAVPARLDTRSALQSLSPHQRACVVLYYYEDQSVAAIADALNCSAGTVKAHLSAARDRLARVLTAAADDPHPERGS